MNTGLCEFWILILALHPMRAGVVTERRAKILSHEAQIGFGIQRLSVLIIENSSPVGCLQLMQRGVRIIQINFCPNVFQKKTVDCSQLPWWSPHRPYKWPYL